MDYIGDLLKISDWYYEENHDFYNSLRYILGKIILNVLMYFLIGWILEKKIWMFLIMWLC